MSSARTVALYPISVHSRCVAEFDVNRFIVERGPSWESLEGLLSDVENNGLKSLSIERARELGDLYRDASSDLVLVRGEGGSASVCDYLNALVARGYAATRPPRRAQFSTVLRFFTHSFPRLFRQEWKLVLASALIFWGGGAIGAAVMHFDPGSAHIVMPAQHADTSPQERVARDEGNVLSGDQSVSFTAFLFTNNIRVTFLAFAAGITAGVGTFAILGLNGVPIGALAAQYHQAGEGLFFWAWILPHGIPELTVVFIAGAAGFVLGRGVLFPGRRRRTEALAIEGKTAVKLIFGGMPLLVFAGIIEGTVSQIHEPTLPYVIKLLIALVLGGFLYAYLLLAGRGEDEEEAASAPRTRASYEAV